MICEPLEKGLAEDIEQGGISLRWDKEKIAGICLSNLGLNIQNTSNRNMNGMKWHLDLFGHLVLYVCSQ